MAEITIEADFLDTLTDEEKDIVQSVGGETKPAGMDSIFRELSVRDDKEYQKKIVGAMGDLVSKGLFEEERDSESNVLLGYKPSENVRSWWEKTNHEA